MNGWLADELAELVQGFNGRLRTGERITVETTEFCEACNPVGSDAYGALDDGRCGACGGSGWLSRSVTLRADEKRVTG